MRYLTGLVIICLLFGTNRSIGQSITVSFTNRPIKEVFNEIEKQSGYYFVYRDEWLKLAKTVTVNVKNVTLTRALDACFANQPLTYSIVEKLIVVKQKETTPAPNPTPAPTPTPEPPVAVIRVNGNVVDTSGAPLPKATILAKTTNKTSLTDNEGNFSIEALPGETLFISFVGFEPREVKVVRGVDIRARMVPGKTELQEVAVVNTGYQKLPKERNAGSFSTVKSEAINQKSVSMNVMDRLEGLASGFSVNNSPGEEKYLLRGVNTIRGDKGPLVVVDGVPLVSEDGEPYGNIESLGNPNDVETIDFLKDATAASIWGSQAANGVIVITTKKGSNKGRKPTVNYNGFFSLRGQPDYDYNKMMNTGQFLQAGKEVFNSNGYLATYPFSVVSTGNATNNNPMVPPHELIQYLLNAGTIDEAQANKSFDSLAALNNRDQYVENFRQPAMLTSHSLSIAGGSDFHNYYGSFAYTNEQGNDKSKLNRFQLNLKQEFNFSKSIKFDLTANITMEDRERFLIPSLPGNINGILPYAMFADESGNPLSMAYLQRYTPFRLQKEQQAQFSLDYIPLLENSYTQNKRNNLQSRLNAGLQIKLAKGLIYEGRAQYQRGNNDYYEFYNQRSYEVRDELVYYTQPAVGTTAATYFLPNTGGIYNTSTGTLEAWTIRNQLLYDREFGTDHKLNLLLGTELTSNTQNIMQVTLRGYDYQTQQYVRYNELFLANTGVSNPVIPLSGSNQTNLLTTPNVIDGPESITKTVSAYTNAAYSFKRRYNFNASLRMDQSNLFGTNKAAQYKPVWSVGSGWIISKEDFFKIDGVKNLALRVTYGLGGNPPLPGTGGPFNIITAQNQTRFSSTGVSYFVSAPANDQLTWEETRTFNVGLDFSIVKGRISGSIDVYDKYSDGIITEQPVDPTTGRNSAVTNFGDISNKGFDFTLNTTNITGKKFTWNTIFNLGHNVNKLVTYNTSFNPTAFNTITASYVEGYPAYSIFGFNYIGLNNQGNPRILSDKGDTLTNFQNVQLNDVYYGGTSSPLWYGGMTNILNYGNFNLSFLIVYNLGHQMRKDVNTFFTGRLTRNIPEYFNNRWKQPGDELITDIPSYIANNNTSATQRYLQFYNNALSNITSASYIRLRDFTLTYNLPKSSLSKVKIANMAIYGQANNFLIWANNNYDIDPEYHNLRSGTRGSRVKPFYTFGIKMGL